MVCFAVCLENRPWVPLRSCVNADPGCRDHGPRVQGATEMLLLGSFGNPGNRIHVRNIQMLHCFVSLGMAFHCAVCI